MALTWDLRQIKDSDNLCYINKSENEPQGEMSAITNTLIWSTMFVGFSKITDKNYKQFHKRLIELELASGGGLLVADDGHSRQPTIHEVKSHVGLSTNASVQSNSQWSRNIARIIQETAEKRIKHEEQQVG
tara:strand:+ start:301 stop:693 length:393 start_codon:yes stop_codon:yes gene_type:complete